MDALIALLIVIGIVNALGSSRKKRREREAQRRAFQQARQGEAAAEPERARRRAAEARPVRTSEELQAHQAAMERASEPAAAGPAVVVRASEPRPAEPRVAATRASEPRPAEPRVAVPRSAQGGEGAISTQGESPEEHAEHLRRAALEEETLRQQHALIHTLRTARRDELRTAIIMSEVLAKPVALRRGVDRGRLRGFAP